MLTFVCQMGENILLQLKGSDGYEELDEISEG